MSFSINNKLGFIDSFQFLYSSLYSLGKNLAKDDFKSFIQEFNNNILDLVKLLKVWNIFEMKTMKNYRDLYLEFDISLLADVFANFRNESITNYGLCPSHYLSA